MKKNILLIVLFCLLLVWCASPNIDQVAMVNSISDIDITTINDLSTLETLIYQVSDAINAGTLSVEKAQKLIEQLQQKYIVLLDTNNVNIENAFARIQKTFSTHPVNSYTLPLWAKKLWMTLPEGMTIDKTHSKYIYDTGYDSTILVYTWDRIVALQQAKIIAQKAHLQLSKSLQQAQSIVQDGNVGYISGLDISELSSWTIYVNHELLDTTIDQLLSVYVDQEWTLTIEATNYKD